jgi:hypothetical protein
MRERTVCSVRNTPRKFTPCRSSVAEHILDCGVTWQTAVRVLGWLVGPALRRPLLNWLRR